MTPFILTNLKKICNIIFETSTDTLQTHSHTHPTTPHSSPYYDYWRHPDTRECSSQVPTSQTLVARQAWLTRGPRWGMDHIAAARDRGSEGMLSFEWSFLVPSHLPGSQSCFWGSKESICIVYSICTIYIQNRVCVYFHRNYNELHCICTNNTVHRVITIFQEAINP